MVCKGIHLRKKPHRTVENLRLSEKFVLRFGVERQICTEEIDQRGIVVYLAHGRREICRVVYAESLKPDRLDLFADKTEFF